MSNLELSVPYEDQVLNINGNPITLEDILEDTSLYINSSLFPTPKDSAFPILDLPCTAEDAKANVTVLDLKAVYEKGQSRRKANSEQRLLNADVNLTATSQKQIQGICAYVERCPEAARILQDLNGRVPIDVTFSKKDPFQPIFLVNLDSVYVSHKGIKVYELSRVKGEERNIFRLIVVLHFLDGTTKEFTSKNFQVQSKKNQKSGQEEDSSSDRGYFGTPSPEHKRKRAKIEEPSPLGSLSSDLNSDNSIITAEVVTDRLEANSALIHQLQVEKPIVTQRGDIAYHFPMNKSDLDVPLEEGDVIGFFGEAHEKTHIEKLTYFNAFKAKMAGVVSRSAYLEAKTPAEDEEKATSDLVCVIGMVNVKVLGQVKNGERIYASMEHPGVAIPQSRVCDAVFKDAFLLGQTLTGQDAGPGEVSLVQSFVSVMLSISSSHVTRAVGDLREHVKEDLKNEVKQIKRKCVRGVGRWLLAGLIFAVLLAVLLYQLFAPGSELRYYRCRQGSIKGSEMWFTFTTHDVQIPRVHGIEFTFEKLKEKMDLTFGEMKFTDAHYYLNLDRCAYGGIRLVGSPIDGKEMVRGAEILAVNHNCTIVYYHSKKWTPYKSGRDIVCKFHT